MPRGRPRRTGARARAVPPAAALPPAAAVLPAAFPPAVLPPAALPQAALPAALPPAEPLAVAAARPVRRRRPPARHRSRSRSRSPPVLIRPPYLSDDEDSRGDRWERLEALIAQQGRQIEELEQQAPAPAPLAPRQLAPRQAPAAALGAPAPIEQQFALPPPLGQQERQPMPPNLFIGPPVNPGPPHGPPLHPLQQAIEQGAWAGFQFPNQGNFETLLTLGATVYPRIKAKIWAGQYVELESLHSVIDQSAQH